VPPLPPPRLRWGPTSLKDDRRFLRSAHRLASDIDRLVGLSPTSRLVDVGCGPGRLVYGIGELSVGSVARYVGVDTNDAVIDWAVEHLARPGVEFHKIDMFNERYNPTAARVEAAGFLPFADEVFDRVSLHSVFSHMRLRDIALYLREVARLLISGGRAYCSAFVENGVPEWTENPDDYGGPWSGPLHCTRLSRGAFDRLVADAGMTVIRFEHRPGKQSFYGLQKP
jgi:SAM-dependent methyltransferase